MPVVPKTLVAAALIALAACADEQPVRWTTTQAESISVVRGTPINRPTCEGVGQRVDGRYERFRCTAGARRPGETLDTVAVRYELEPTEEYSGASSAHRLENVSFLGGPGIP